MTIRVDSASLIAGKTVVSVYVGHGMPASQIPSSGTHGPGYLFNDIAAQGAAPTDEMRGEILTWPSAGTLTVNEDSSFSFTGAPNGSYSFSYRGYRNGVAYGDFTVSLTVGPAAQVPQGATTVGTVASITHNSASVPFTYSASDQTGFQYSLNGTDNPVTVPGGASPITLSGLVANTAYAIYVRAVNATGNGAWSAVHNFTTTAAPQVPQGAFIVGSITVGQTTASVTYTYSAGDATGIQYQLNSTGTIFSATASPLSLAGLTAGTGYTIRFRAVNATGNGTWSTPINFTTKQLMKIVSGVLRDNTGKKLSNEPLKYFAIYDAETGELVLRLTALSTDTAGRVSVQHAKLVEGKRYKFDWETQGGTYRMPSRVAA